MPAKSEKMPRPEPNPHAHIVLTKGNLPARRLRTQESVLECQRASGSWHTRWEIECNQALEDGGKDGRVNARSLTVRALAACPPSMKDQRCGRDGGARDCRGSDPIADRSSGPRAGAAERRRMGTPGHISPILGMPPMPWVGSEQGVVGWRIFSLVFVLVHCGDAYYR